LAQRYADGEEWEGAAVVKRRRGEGEKGGIPKNVAARYYFLPFSPFVFRLLSPVLHHLSVSQLDRGPIREDFR
jgi:hypothetical protein